MLTDLITRFTRCEDQVRLSSESALRAVDEPHLPEEPRSATTSLASGSGTSQSSSWPSPWSRRALGVGFGLAKPWPNRFSGLGLLRGGR